jgi:hypothetical protein
MRFLTTIFIVLLSATLILAAPTSVNITSFDTASGDCEKSTRYACGQYQLADGTRQDFFSQVYACHPRDKFTCNKVAYQASNPTHAGEASYMVAAKVDPGCSCTFYV